MTKEIQELIKKCKENNSTILKLDGKGLTDIPEEIYELTHLKNLSLMNNQITSVSPKILQLQELEELWLTSNQLEEIPIEISQLPNLRRLHLTDNKLIKFPIEYLKNERLSHLCIRDNLIEELPEEIEQIKIRDISLSNNKIKSIPITYDNADFFLTLDLRENPLEEPPASIFNAGISNLLRFLIERDRGRTFVIPFTDELKTTFKQYLTYFGDFVKNTKGKFIGFEIKDVEEGLEIEVKTENNTDEEIEEVRRYMQEYVSFIKTQIDEITPNFEIQVDDTKRDFVVLELKSQLRHLQTQVEIKIASNKALTEDRDRYYNLLLNMTSSKSEFVIYNNSSSQNLLIQKNQYIAKISSNLPSLIAELNELRKYIPPSEEFAAKELSEVDYELLKMEDCEIDESNIKKVPFKKLKRVLEEINDEKSTLNQVVKGSKKAIEAAQSLGKTYNNFAEWLALPQVPKIFLGK
ncbi:MAG: leucine-rich repeat domain-containing protein [Sphingobacteriales bacterium]|nr:leucine-rich repeat domain-containing protein [Sphingobacteriales bacterium]